MVIVISGASHQCCDDESPLPPVLAQVDEMEKAVDVAEKNAARFGLSLAEISGRRKWVLQTRRQVHTPVANMLDIEDTGSPPAPGPECSEHSTNSGGRRGSLKAC